MKKSQLNAISNSYHQKNAKATEQRAKDMQIDLMFKYQTVYKTLSGFINAKAERRLVACKEAFENLTKRKRQLELCGCRSEKYDECIQALAQAKNALR